METLLRRVGIYGLLLMLPVMVGTVGYRIAGLGWTDALYQTVITVTTVGYSDLAPAHKGFTILMVAFGTLTLAMVVSLVTAGIVETQILNILGRRRVERQVAKLEDHLIICGFGRFGRIIAEELDHKGLPFVVVEMEPIRVKQAQELGYLAIEADATEEESLTAAGIQRSRGLLTTLGTDAANVYVSLTVKQIHPSTRVVAIAQDPHERAAQKLRAAGADEVVSPYQLGGAWMAQAATSPTAADFMKMATGANPLNFYMDEQRIGEESDLCGKMIKDTPIRSDFGVIIVGVRRADGSLITNPHPDLTLAAGDVLVSLGEQESLAALQRHAAGA